MSVSIRIRHLEIGREVHRYVCKCLYVYMRDLNISEYSVFACVCVVNEGEGHPYARFVFVKVLCAVCCLYIMRVHAFARVCVCMCLCVTVRVRLLARIVFTCVCECIFVCICNVIFVSVVSACVCVLICEYIKSSVAIPWFKAGISVYVYVCAFVYISMLERVYTCLYIC